MSGSTQQTIITFSKDITDAPPPPLLPPRTYRAEVISAAVRPSQGNPEHWFWNVGLRVPSSEYPADFEGDPEGTTVYFNRARADDSITGAYQTRKLMEMIGGPLGKQIDCNALLGLWANIEVSHNTFQGETRAQVARVLSP